MYKALVGYTNREDMYLMSLSRLIISPTCFAGETSQLFATNEGES